MEIEVKCKNCNKHKVIKNPMRCNPIDLEFCNEKCNEAYFKKYGSGLVPRKYQNRYRILNSGGKAIVID